MTDRGRIAPASRRSTGGAGVSTSAMGHWGDIQAKTLLIAENLCLRQQLLVLQRRYPRPQLSNAYRRFWILASRWFGGWRRPLRIVRPETVLRWHRRGWRAYWTRLSHRTGKRGRRPLPQELRALIRRMAAENWLWGQKRIQAELARLGFIMAPHVLSADQQYSSQFRRNV